MGNEEEEIELSLKDLEFRFILRHGNGQLAVGNPGLKSTKGIQLKK